MPDIEPFISPITKEVITGRRQLRGHMKRHGVTNAADYSKDWYANKSKKRYTRSTGQDRASKQDRINSLKQQF